MRPRNIGRHGTPSNEEGLNNLGGGTKGSKGSPALPSMEGSGTPSSETRGLGEKGAPQVDPYALETVWYKTKSRTYTQGEGRWEIFQRK